MELVHLTIQQKWLNNLERNFLRKKHHYAYVASIGIFSHAANTRNYVLWMIKCQSNIITLRPLLDANLRYLQLYCVKNCNSRNKGIFKSFWFWYVSSYIEISDTKSWYSYLICKTNLFYSTAYYDINIFIEYFQWIYSNFNAS